MKMKKMIIMPVIIALAALMACSDKGGSDGSAGLFALLGLSGGAPGAPAAPTVAAAAGQLTVTWSAVSGAESYQVWYGTTNDSAAATRFGGDFTSTACLITGLTNGTPYYVWIKSISGGVENGFSPSGGGTPASTALSKSDVVFAYGSSSTDTAILRMNDTTPITTLEIVPADTSAATVLLAQPSPSLDRSMLAYLHSITGDTYIKFKNSGGTIDITPSNFDFSGDYAMALSPDGSKLAYVDEDNHISVITATASPTPLTLTNCASGMDKYPTWSPDGAQIAFVHFDTDSNSKIYKVRADGSSASPYGEELFSWNTTTAGNESLISLRWSPTNPYQMVCSSRYSSANVYFFVYTLNLTTKERTKLTGNTTQHEHYPQWSKDGNYIFYEINNNIYYKSIDNAGASGTQMTTDGKSSFKGWEPS
ncbi:MAG: DPP IV N-terminal domain-containing protein [Spirochaetes bacterium]|nr:DPP IV N-terminal domain-containing protein [Spirochaetota bacterium]